MTHMNNLRLEYPSLVYPQQCLHRNMGLYLIVNLTAKDLLSNCFENIVLCFQIFERISCLLFCSLVFDAGKPSCVGRWVARSRFWLPKVWKSTLNMSECKMVLVCICLSLTLILFVNGKLYWPCKWHWTFIMSSKCSVKLSRANSKPRLFKF